MHSVYILNLIFWIFVLIGWRAEYQASFEKVMITIDTERNNVAFWPIFCNRVFRTGNALIGMTVVIAFRLLSLQTPRVYSYIISILRKWRYTKFIKAQASWNHWWTATRSKSFWWMEATARSWSKNQFFFYFVKQVQNLHDCGCEEENPAQPFVKFNGHDVQGCLGSSILRQHKIFQKINISYSWYEQEQVRIRG